MNGPAALAIAGGAIWALALVLWLHAGFRDRRVEAASEALPTDDTPAEDDPAWERHCGHALATVDERWNGIDELQYRRLVREYRNHPTTH